MCEARERSKTIQFIYARIVRRRCVRRVFGCFRVSVIQPLRVHWPIQILTNRTSLGGSRLCTRNRCSLYDRTTKQIDFSVRLLYSGTRSSNILTSAENYKRRLVKY